MLEDSFILSLILRLILIFQMTQPVSHGTRNLLLGVHRIWYCPYRLQNLLLRGRKIRGRIPGVRWRSNGVGGRHVTGIEREENRRIEKV